MLGLSGKERHAVLPLVAHTPSPQNDTGKATELSAHSGQSSGRSGVVRPQVGCKPARTLQSYNGFGFVPAAPELHGCARRITCV